MIVLVTAQLPPQRDGIGDYTARLAESLAQQNEDVAVWTSSDRPVDPVSGVPIAQPFSLSRRRDVFGILGAVDSLARRSRLPEALVLQFNQFSWGRWGLNLNLPRVMWRIKRRWPQIKLCVMFHEKIVPPTSWKFHVMRLWQVHQYSSLADCADVRLFSIEKWAMEERMRRPDRACAESVHLPVGSNILPSHPPSPASQRMRMSLGIAEDSFVLGSFGTPNPAKLTDWVVRAARHVRSSGRSVVLLHIGGGSDEFLEHCGELPVVAPGHISTSEVSACLETMDLFLSPFVDGASTRRGSLIAALAHGIPFITTAGPLTDKLWHSHFGSDVLVDVSAGPTHFSNQVLALVDDAPKRASLAETGRSLYEQTFHWNELSRKLVDQLRDAADQSLRPPSGAETTESTAI